MAGYLRTAVVLVVLSLAGCAAGPSRDVELNDQGYYAMQAGEMQKAEDLLKQALAENPDNPQALTNLGALYQNTERPEMARPLYERVIALAAERGDASSEEGRELSRLAAVARANLQMIDRQQAEREAAEQQAAAPEPEVVPEPVVEAPAPEPMPVGPEFRAQVGAFSSQANAERMRAMLMERHGEVVAGKEVHVIPVDGLVKVQIGPFGSMREANRACRALKGAGMDCLPSRP